MCQQVPRNEGGARFWDRSAGGRFKGCRSGGGRARNVLQFMMVRGTHWRRAVLASGARWFLSGGGHFALGGGNSHGPGAHCSFSAWQGLKPLVQAAANRRFLGRLDDSHVILFMSVAKSRSYR